MLPALQDVLFGGSSTRKTSKFLCATDTFLITRIAGSSIYYFGSTSVIIRYKYPLDVIDGCLGIGIGLLLA